MAEDWLAHVISGDDAVDIDTLDDFEYAEFLLGKRGS
jgi:CMP-N-acetylneuraminic acid synthetase